METIWTKTKWTIEQLDHRSAEFRIHTKIGLIHQVGEFWVRQNPDGLLAVDAVAYTQGRDAVETVRLQYFLPQTAVDQIERHPDQTVAEFRLFLEGETSGRITPAHET